METTRRRFLKAAGSAAAAVAIAPSISLAESRSLSDNVLVVLQLSGGNDGLNTVVPFKSAEYYAARPCVALPPRSLLPISRDLAFHPALRPLKSTFDAGQLAVINGCGHPNPSRSHFRSLEIWHTAQSATESTAGWLAGLPALNVGPFLPQAVAETTASVLPDGHGLSHQMQLIANRIAIGGSTRVFYTQIAGFDTHANQLTQHDNQLRQVADSLASFLKTLRATGNADRVTVLCFSEFGRRLVQNNSNGTDHGTAGPMFVLGAKVNGGIYGAHPSLSDLADGDLKYTTDFRRVYATLLDRWVGVDAAAVLGNRFEPIAFL